MDVHPPKNGIFIGIDPYPYGKITNVPNHQWYSWCFMMFHGASCCFMLFLRCAHRIIPGLVLVDETWTLKCNSSYQIFSRSLRFAVWCGSFLDCGGCESKDCGVYCNPSTAATLSFAGGMLAARSFVYQLRVDPKRTTCVQFNVRTFCSKRCSCERVGKSFRRRYHIIYNIYIYIYVSWALPETKTDVVALLEAGMWKRDRAFPGNMLNSFQIHQPGNNLDQHLSPPSQLERQGRPGVNWVIGPLYQPILCLYHPAEWFWDCPQEVLSSIRAPGVDVLHFQLATLSTFQKEWIDRSLDFAMLKVNTWRQRWAKYGKVMLHIHNMLCLVMCCMFAHVCPSFLWLCESLWYVFPGKVWKDASLQDVSAPRCGWSTHGPSRRSGRHPGRSWLGWMGASPKTHFWSQTHFVAIPNY